MKWKFRFPFSVNFIRGGKCIFLLDHHHNKIIVSGVKTQKSLFPWHWKLELWIKEWQEGLLRGLRGFKLAAFWPCSQPAFALPQAAHIKFLMILCIGRDTYQLSTSTNTCLQRHCAVDCSFSVGSLGIQFSSWHGNIISCCSVCFNLPRAKQWCI